ncbi:LacI family DNA-binding transcriptional regulator [Enterococcus quebecensis]|uniref:LacI family transcriptional regulator n=1 Tax=Enterococcus quebecensis TaxID=903983 RepID=A0A1E5GR62_9ENTE|nr:LacI family DNA-binding transcriptional regulator [Enterococcus quebecensis]OEG15177.1 LacI family transcriptional regulator [Enterococcus quebecensis]OJG74754.1 hypothetical protein RV12_GL002171 [Enterococcus quebecensis]
MITINDIAKIAGVAKSTVSRYLNGGSISSTTASKIEAVIKEHNYVPSTFAQSLKAKNSRLIGFIIPRLDSRAAIATLEGIDKKVQEHDYQLLIANTNQSTEEEVRRIYAFAKEKVSGIILMATEITEKHIQAVKEVGIPTIFVGQEHEEVYSVVHDDYQAGFEFTRQLLALGHRKITYFSVAENDHAVGVLRKKGVLDAIKQEAPSSVDVVETTFSMVDAIDIGMSQLESNHDSLWIAATDNIAVGLLKAAHTMKVAVPEQLSLAGFGGYDISDYVYPSLSTVHFRYVEAGEQSFHYLDQLIKGEDIPKKTVIDFDIYHRESVADLT